MEAHVWTMRAEDYWQTAGKHKSNIGGSSVISKLSVAGLVVVNQDNLHLIQGCTKNPVLKQNVFFDLPGVKMASTCSGKSCFFAWEDRQPRQITPVTGDYPQSVKFCDPNWSNLIWNDTVKTVSPLRSCPFRRNQEVQMCMTAAGYNN